MTFLLRAALVIGVLSYLAATRQGSAPGEVDTAQLRATVEQTTRGLAHLATALPPEARAEAVRIGSEALSKHIAGSAASADTLSASDRLPPWRGTSGLR